MFILSSTRTLHTYNTEEDLVQMEYREIYLSVKTNHYLQYTDI